MDFETSNPQGNLGQDGQADAIASLLVEEDNSEGEVESSKPKDNPKSSNKERGEVEDVVDEDSDDEEDDHPQDDLPDESTDEDSDTSDEDEATWESVLGVDEGQIDFDEEGNPKGILTKVEGKVESVPLKDLIAGYQKDKAISIKGQRLAEERSNFDKEVETTRADFAKKLENAEIVTTYLAQKLQSQMSSTDWERLRNEDPAEYAAAQYDFQRQQQEIQHALRAIQEERQNEAKKYHEDAVNKQKEFVGKQREKMLENNPHWNDEATYKKEMGEIRQFLSDNYGFSDQDFNSVYDARLVELAKDLKKLSDAARVGKQKLSQKSVPKFQKSSGKTRKGRKSSKLETLTKAASKAKGSNKRNLQSEAIAQLLIGDS